jgi:hypothetical protein
MHLFHLFAGQGLYNKQLIVAQVELRTTATWRVDCNGLTRSQAFPIIHVIHSKAFPQISEHQRAVLLHLEMTRHVLPAQPDKSLLKRYFKQASAVRNSNT